MLAPLSHTLLYGDRPENLSVVGVCSVSRRSAAKTSSALEFDLGLVPRLLGWKTSRQVRGHREVAVRSLWTFHH